MKFECLPNEIIVECFEYFNGIDLFYGFNQLNNRFTQLIQSFPLYLNFENVDRLTFERLCSTIFFNPDIKLRIVGLKLSNAHANKQIETFLRHFPLNRYPYLRSLTLIGLFSNHVKSLSFMLLWLNNLSCLSFVDLMRREDPCEIMSALQISKIQRLSMPNLDFDLDFTPEMTRLTNLNILFCYLAYLCELLSYTPMLKYLNIKRIGGNNYHGNNKTIENNFNVIHLNELIIQQYEDTLEHLEILIKKTSDVKSFTLIIKLYEIPVINADYWQNLVTTYLPHLKVFKFNFTTIFHEYYAHILKRFQRFQSDFWCKQHQWYTMNEIRDSLASIYTVPYALNKYELIASTTKFSDTVVNKFDVFNNVTNLIVLARSISNDFQYYFSNVEKLQFTNHTTFLHDWAPFELTMDEIICLKKIMNFSKIKILKIWRGCRIKSTILLEILKLSPQLSSLVIEKSMLFSFFENNELNQYLNQMIDQLDINRCSENIFLKSKELNLFCKIFSNVKHLECCINKSTDFLFLIDHLSKLTQITVHYSSRTYREEICDELRKTARQRNLNCLVLYRQK